MVGFWEKIQSKDREVDKPGPGQPFPGRHTSEQGAAVPVSKYTWPAEMTPVDIPVQPTDRSVGSDIAWVEPVTLARVWEAVEGDAPTAPINQPINAHYNVYFQGF